MEVYQRSKPEGMVLLSEVICKKICLQFFFFFAVDKVSKRSLTLNI